MTNENPGEKFRGKKKKLRLALLGVFVLMPLLPLTRVAAGTTVEAAAEKTGVEVEELWYRVEVSGSAAGFMVERQIDDGEQLISESEMRLSFRRGGAAQKLVMSSRFVETHDHRPLSLWSRQELGAQPLETNYRFVDDGVLMSSTAGEQKRPAPEGEWLTPFAAENHLKAEARKLLDGGAPDGGVRSIEARSLDPALGLQPVTTRWALEEARTSVPIDGVEREASRWRQSQSYAPQVASEIYLSPDGVLLKSVTPILGLEMAIVLSTESEVRSLGDGPELLVQSFIFPNQRIDKPRQLERAVYRFLIDGEAYVLPTVGAQRQEGDRIVVDMRPSGAAPEKDPAPDEKYLVSSTYIQHQAPSLKTLYQRAVAKLGEHLEPVERAESLRRFVARHLQEKNLDSVLATAVEAASTRSGDCTEHAVLLAALLRADGIPARVATGVIYVEHFAGKRHLFAYHMWTQARLDGRWRDFDATLGDAAAFDAAHLTLDTPDLDDEGAALMHMASVAPLIGRASIEIIETGIDEAETSPSKQPTKETP